MVTQDEIVIKMHHLTGTHSVAQGEQITVVSGTVLMISSVLGFTHTCHLLQGKQAAMVTQDELKLAVDQARKKVKEDAEKNLTNTVEAYQRKLTVKEKQITEIVSVISNTFVDHCV